MAYAPSFTKGVLRIENLSVITSLGEVDCRQVREVIVQKWPELSQELYDGTILFIAGVHGQESGKLGDFEDSCRHMMSQVKSYLQ